MPRPRRVPQLILVLAALIVVIAASARFLRRPSPNLILITVDTLRPDHLGGYGYPRGTSPGIDALARAGTGFTTTIVPRGQTWPTLASILTSLYPVTHGVRKNGQKLEIESPTLAELLSEHGYTCFASLSNSGRAEWPGFERVHDRRDRDQEVHQVALEWLRENSNRKFFLWVHYFAPHRPFRAPGKMRRRFDPGYGGPIDGSIAQMNRLMAGRIDLSPADLHHMISLYDGEIAWIDHRVAELGTRLRELGLERKTLVVFTSDHGEELYERNHYVSHSASIYDSVLRVPLIWSWPGVIPAGRWERGVVQALDIAPTLLEFAGIEAPPHFEGRSLARWIRTGREPGEPSLAFSELEDRVVSVRSRDCRFIHNPTDFDFPVTRDDPEVVYPIAREELYLLREDPLERYNVADRYPELATKLREEVLQWQRDHEWEKESARHRAREIPPEVRESLEAIGYVQ